MSIPGKHTETLPGLCARCAAAEAVENARGFRFILCRLSSSDGRYPKYPRLPVSICDGFRPGPENETLA